MLRRIQLFKNKRRFTSISPPLVEHADDKGDLLYTGAFDSVLMKIKMVSLFSCTSTLVGVPFLTFAGNPEMPLKARLAMGAVVCGFGLGTTGALHIVSKPYATKLWYNDQRDCFTSESINFFCQRRYTSFSFDQITPPASGGLFSSFSINNDKNVFVHQDKSFFGESSVGERLLRKISSYHKVESEQSVSSEDKSGPAKGAVIKCKSSEEFDALVNEHTIIVDFTATWCGPCKMIGPVFDQLAEQNSGDVKFVKVDVDELQDVAMKAGISAMPTFQVWRDGVKVEEFAGANPEMLADLCSKHC